MPRYDFRCAPCEWTFEAVLPFASDELPPCPKCGKRATEKVVSPPLGIHFHGSGFYKTDSRPVEKTKPPTEKSPAPATTPEKTTETPHPEPSLPAGRQVPKGEGTTEAPKTEKSPKKGPSP